MSTETPTVSNLFYNFITNIIDFYDISSNYNTIWIDFGNIGGLLFDSFVKFCKLQNVNTNNTCACIEYRKINSNGGQHCFKIFQPMVVELMQSGIIPSVQINNDNTFTYTPVVKVENV